jgi:hypothetical protein
MLRHGYWFVKSGYLHVFERGLAVQGMHLARFHRLVQVCKLNACCCQCRRQRRPQVDRVEHRRGQYGCCCQLASHQSMLSNGWHVPELALTSVCEESLGTGQTRFASGEGGNGRGLVVPFVAAARKTREARRLVVGTLMVPYMVFWILDDIVTLTSIKLGTRNTVQPRLVTYHSTRDSTHSL